MEALNAMLSESIDLNNRGVGGITYYGNPVVTNLNKSDIGKIKAGKKVMLEIKTDVFDLCRFYRPCVLINLNIIKFITTRKSTNLPITCN